MALMVWSDQFSIGIQSVDDQHKKLVEYVNELHDAMMSGKSDDVLGPILNNLIDYTANHFAFEEKLFCEHNYPDTTAHTAEHKALAEKVIAFNEDFKRGDASISLGIMSFLKDWLMNHILKSDKKYSPFLIEKGVK